MTGSPFRWRIGPIIIVLLFGPLGLALLNLLAIAPQWEAKSYYLELTIDNFVRFGDRVSIATWYSSSLFLVIAILLFGLAWTRSIPRAGPNTALGSTLGSKPAAPRSSWVYFGILGLLISLDKATGLHHALIHDFLYRLPFSVAVKKGVLVMVGSLVMIWIGQLLRSMAKELQPFVRRLLLFSALFFAGSELGLNVLTPHVLPSGNSLHPIFSIGEQFIEQLGGVLLVWALLMQIRSDFEKWIPPRESP